MQRSLIQAAGIVLMSLIANYAFSGTAEAPAVPKEEGAMMKTDLTGSAGVVAPSGSGSSIVERDKKRYEIQKRAAERRAVEMKKAEKARKKAKPGSSVAERDKQRYENQKRAAERRAVEMKKAEESGKTTDMNKKDPVKEQGQTPMK